MIFSFCTNCRSHWKQFFITNVAYLNLQHKLYINALCDEIKLGRSFVDVTQLQNYLNGLIANINNDSCHIC